MIEDVVMEGSIFRVDCEKSNEDKILYAILINKTMRIDGYLLSDWKERTLNQINICNIVREIEQYNAKASKLIKEHLIQLEEKITDIYKNRLYKYEEEIDAIYHNSTNKKTKKQSLKMIDLLSSIRLYEFDKAINRNELLSLWQIIALGKARRNALDAEIKIDKFVRNNKLGVIK